MSSLGDVAGHFNIIAKALRPLGLADLKAVYANLEITIATLPVAQRKVVLTLFHDVVAMIGTNPAIMLVKEHLLDTTKYVFKLNLKSERKSTRPICIKSIKFLRSLQVHFYMAKLMKVSK